MSEVTLVRQGNTPITDADREAVRRVLFGIVDGLGELNRKRWRRFIARLIGLEPGEILSVRTHKDRSGPFHRRHMAIEQRVFEAQERFVEFEQFRNWLKVGAGFCDWVVGPKGGVIPVPKSIAFDKLEDDEMREVHESMISFLRSEHAIKALWPRARFDVSWQGVDSLLQEFGE